MIERILLIFLLTTEAAWAQSTSFYQLEAPLLQKLSLSEKTQIQTFFTSLEARLPLKLKQVFSRGIQVKFQKLESHHHGRAQSGQVILNSDLIPLILRGELDTTPSLDPAGNLRTHKTLFRETQATVLHETAHLYDFKNVRPKHEKAFIDHCKTIARDPEMLQPEGCEVYLNTKTTLSSDPYYLEVAGWPLSVQGQNYRESENIYGKRTADPYELKNPVEHFAVNFAYFLLDAEFACRKPSLANFLEAHFQHRPFKTSCGPLLYVDPSAPNSNQLIRALPMDRVYQIHYLHADQGEAMMSRWGHAMFRLVICAPSRKTIGPECLNDEYHHLVLSFRAFVDTHGIESWKGLTGKYPSRLFFVSLEEVKQSYNVDEFRDVISYPLSLTQKEKESFLKRAIETHWNYDSRYYFLTNNCATESLNLLKSAVLRPELLESKAIKPTDLRNLLIKTKLIQHEALRSDRKENIRLGLLFDNHADRYMKALSILTGTQVNLSQVKDHIESNFKTRQLIYQNRKSAVSLKELAAIVILEEAALRKTKARARSFVLGHVIDKAQKTTEKWIKDLSSSHKRAIELFNIFSAPHEFVSYETYGIPLQEELQRSAEEIKLLWKEKRQNMITRSQSMESHFLTEETTEINQTRAYLDQTLENLYSSTASK